MFRLQPKIHPIVHRFLQQKTLLFQLEKSFQKPLYLLFPQVMKENAIEFSQTLKELRLKYKIYFAVKSNPSHTFLSAAKEAQIGINVNSLFELRRALEHGFTGKEIVASGLKDANYLQLCIAHSVIISVNSILELTSVIEHMTMLRKKKPIDIFVQWAAITAKYSSFGVPLFELDVVLKILKNRKDIIHLEGFSFHLDSNDLDEKVEMIQAVMEAANRAISSGLQIHSLNIGGGFSQVFIENKKEWLSYIEQIKAFTWKGSIPPFQKFGNTVSPAQALQQVITPELRALLQDAMMTLIIEPGKSMVDQAGMTVTRVTQVKKISDSEAILGLNAGNTILSVGSQEMMIDPVIVKLSEQKDAGNYTVYFADQHLMEHGLIYTHKTFLTELPLVGDLIIFTNTAGYTMAIGDCAEQIAKTPIVAINEHNNQWEWHVDNALLFTK